jgi:antibiotic biosynthesis monooxygenase (ABM) superfamily enzyme
VSEHAVTILISRNVKIGCEAHFVRVISALKKVAGVFFGGYLGAQIIQPGQDLEVQDSMYHILLAFSTQAPLDAWNASPERELGLEAAKLFIEGPTTIKPLSGLGFWFRNSQQGPARWKVAVVTWMGILPMVYFLFWITADALRFWTLLPCIPVLTLAFVLIMTWVIAPQLTKLLRPWLFARHEDLKKLPVLTREFASFKEN